MRFVRAPERMGAYGHAIILTTRDGSAQAAQLVAELHAEVQTVEVRECELADPSNYQGVFEVTRRAVTDLRGDTDVVLSAGTPQMQTVWVVLVKAGLLDARLFQVIPPAFVPRPHPEATREVDLDFEGFPEIMALRRELDRLRANSADDGIVGDSDGLGSLRARIARVAPSAIPLLITGETGVGKELVARAIHDQSERREQPFVAENCGALSEAVLESELFGHERGAFTGAHATRRGLFERAHGGTLFLDEVGELSPRMQSNLLRVLQEGRFRRVGGEDEVQVDVRVLGATHRDLARMVSAGSFREDLFYRLAGALLHVPPLRDRIEDLPLLVAAFEGEGAPVLSGGALKALRRYAWPGNIRQLRAEVRRWGVFCDGGVVRLADLSPEIRGEAPTAHGLEYSVRTIGDEFSRDEIGDSTLAAAVLAAEERAIIRALRECAGNIAQSARKLSIDRNTLKRKIERLALAPVIAQLRQKPARRS